MVNKFDLTYTSETIWNKDLFVFVNHKVAVICWAILKEKTEVCDVISFDSHQDYRNGVILQQEITHKSFTLHGDKRCFSSKYNRDFPHFITSKEFIDWNPLDPKQNEKLIQKQRKYFLPNNDNFIDVAFMKGIVKNVYCYFYKTRNITNSGKCDDIFGNDHIYKMRSVDTFEQFSACGKYILDIDLDFFTRFNYESGVDVVAAERILKKYLLLMRSLAQQDNCVGITIALEPACCGSEENCLKICEHFTDIFDKDLVYLAKDRLKTNYKICGT